MNRWPTVRLSELVTKVGSGATPKGGHESYKPTGIPLIRSMNVHLAGVRDEGLVFLDEGQARSLDGATVCAGDVLLNITGASIGRVAIAPPRLNGARVNQHVCIIRPKEHLLPELLWRYLSAPRQQAMILAEEAGATRQALTKDKILNIEVPLPSIGEQRRIVAKLDTLQARSWRAREALEEVPALLEKLRQSILAAAFRGDLTKDWRAKNPDVEPAEKLLQRIRAERRKKWEEAELARMQAKGKPPTDDRWKEKYSEPEPIDTSGMPHLPAGWCWTSIGELFDVGVGATPSRSEPSYWNGGIPWVSSGEVAFCRIRTTRETISHQGLESSSTELHPPGTVLIGMIGEGRTRGQVAILDVPACNNQNAAAIRVSESPMAPEYVYHYLRLAYERTRRVGSGNNQQALNKQRVQALPLALAPLTEQVRLTKLIETAESRLSLLRSMHLDVAQMQRGLEHAFLQKAFRGELVPQDPNDEPADVMLARLRSAAPSSTSSPTSSPSSGKRRGRPRKS